MTYHDQGAHFETFAMRPSSIIVISLACFTKIEGISAQMGIEICKFGNAIFEAYESEEISGVGVTGLDKVNILVVKTFDIWLEILRI